MYVGRSGESAATPLSQGRCGSTLEATSPLCLQPADDDDDVGGGHLIAAPSRLLSQGSVRKTPHTGKALEADELAVNIGALLTVNRSEELHCNVAARPRHR
mmetsp:Transcript_28454/g.74771  ORF Transcript_28454/g.74771 Transcript_28454/m.74771 type:complete len:101 (+) Transcript_28454:605-907(+)